MAKAWSYTVTTPPGCYPISLDELKNHLKISGNSEDDVLTQIIAAVTLYAEGYTKRDFITRTYTTHRDYFSGVGEIRRSKLQSITSIKYLVDGVLTLVDSSVYYFTDETDFTEILTETDQSWPTNADTKRQAVEIIFTAGYGADERSVPEDLKVALMQHATNYHENRGDCSLSDAVPAISRLIYNQYRIFDMRLGE